MEKKKTHQGLCGDVLSMGNCLTFCRYWKNKSPKYQKTVHFRPLFNNRKGLVECVRSVWSVWSGNSVSLSREQTTALTEQTDGRDGNGGGRGRWERRRGREVGEEERQGQRKYAELLSNSHSSRDVCAALPAAL